MGKIEGLPAQSHKERGRKKNSAHKDTKANVQEESHTKARRHKD